MIEKRQPDPTARFIGAALIAVGAMVFGLCGVCTLSFVGTGLYAMIRYPAGAGGSIALVPIVAIVGGGPTLLGFLIMRSGRRRFRANAPKPPPAVPPPG